jgi:uncharacterized protein
MLLTSRLRRSPVSRVSLVGEPVVIEGLPPLTMMDSFGDVAVADRSLRIQAPPLTDRYRDPVESGSVKMNSPALVFHPTGDFQLSARIAVEFRATFDAGVLLVHRSADEYAKFCFEFSPEGDHMVVSVVTRGVSDDANGPIVEADSVDLRVSRIGPVYAFHYSVGGGRWNMVRVFRLRTGGEPTAVGFSAQSPTGDGCSVEFSDISYSATTLSDIRGGS